MISSHSAEEILNSIDFELLQGMVSRDELSEAVQAIRMFQNKARGDVFQSLKRSDEHSEFIRRQFQLNDMLLNLLYELTRVVQSLQSEIRNMPKSFHLNPDIKPVDSNMPFQAKKTVAASGQLADELEWRSQREIESAMRPEALHIEFQGRSFQIPVIGWLLTRLKNFYQRPALSFVQLHSERQAAVNRVFGDRILYLEKILQNQQQEIQNLRAQLGTTAGADTGNLDKR